MSTEYRNQNQEFSKISRNIRAIYSHKNQGIAINSDYSANISKCFLQRVINLAEIILRAYNWLLVTLSEDSPRLFGLWKAVWEKFFCLFWKSLLTVNDLSVESSLRWWTTRCWERVRRTAERQTFLPSAERYLKSEQWCRHEDVTWQRKAITVWICWEDKR